MRRQSREGYGYLQLQYLRSARVHQQNHVQPKHIPPLLSRLLRNHCSCLRVDGRARGRRRSGFEVIVLAVGAALLCQSRQDGKRGDVVRLTRDDRHDGLSRSWTSAKRTNDETTKGGKRYRIESVGRWERRCKARQSHRCATTLVRPCTRLAQAHTQIVRKVRLDIGRYTAENLARSGPDIPL